MIKLSYVLLAVSRTNIFNYFVLGVQNDIPQFTEVFDNISNFKMAIDINISMRRLFFDESEIRILNELFNEWVNDSIILLRTL